MLDIETKRRIDTARDILVGKVPDPKSQVEQITIALIYKFMDDMDVEAEELGGERTFFRGAFAKYAWRKIFDPRIGGFELLSLYGEAITKMDTNPDVPALFRNIFKNAYLPYRDPETLKIFLKVINDFEYTHSEKLGDAFEYLLSVLGSQGDAGQFRTPRHIIDFMVEIMNPQKHESVLDPACGTAGFLISSFKHVIKQNSSNYNPDEPPLALSEQKVSVNELVINNTRYKGDKLTADDRNRLAGNIFGYDISPDMVRLSLVNMYLHGIKEPHITEYDTLTSEDNWNQYADVVLANPPFMSPKGGIRPHKRFSVPSNRSEVLFVDYIAEHLTPNGRAAVIVPEGIIFQSGNAYKTLRKMLVENYLVGVISLPAGVFQPYSGVKTSILWLDRTIAKRTDKIFFVKIENDGFDLGAQRRPINKNDLTQVIKAIQAYKEALLKGSTFNTNYYKQILVVEKSKIAVNVDHNLSGERYTIPIDNNSKFKIVKLSSVAELIGGYAFKSEELKNESDSNCLPVIKIGNVDKSGRINLDSVQYYPFSESLKRFLIFRGDALIAMTGATVGKVAVSEYDDLLLNQRVGVIRLKDKILNISYLNKLLLNERFYSYCQRTAGGGAQGNISPSEILNFEIPIPPLNIQQAITEEIEGYQKIIDGARMVVENYKPRIDIDSEWEMVELGEVVNNFQYGSSKKSHQEGQIPCLRMGNIQDGEINFEDLKYAPDNEDIEKYLLEPNDVLFNRTNSPIHVGKTGIFRANSKAVFAGYLIRIRYKKNKILGEFLNYCLNSKSAKEFCQKVKTDGINQSNINPKNLATFMIPLPPLEVQRQIVSQIEKERELANSNKQLIEIFEQKIKDRISKVWGE
jgi:type I restriction enzyme M protein